MKNVEKLRVLDLLGVFYWEGEKLMVADEFDGTREVRQAFDPFVGHQLRVLAHHRPPEPVSDTLWGGGACMYESVGECPFGHHANPRHLYTFQQAGELAYRPKGRDSWSVGETRIDVEYLVGHRSQITIINKPDLESIREKVESFNPGNLEGASVDDLIDRVGSLRDYLSHLQDLAKDLDA